MKVTIWNITMMLNEINHVLFQYEYKLIFHAKWILKKFPRRRESNQRHRTLSIVARNSIVRTPCPG